MSTDKGEGRLPRTQSGGTISRQEADSKLCSPEFGVAPKCRNVCIETFGCQMNSRDSEVIAGLMEKAGYAIVDGPETADVVIFNTCSVRQHAEDKVWSEIGRMVKLRKGKDKGEPHLKPLIGLVGCMAQNYKEKVFDTSPHVDFVVGPTDIHNIPEIVSSLISSGASGVFERKIWETDSVTRPEEIYHTGHYEDKEHAFVVISEGCSNFCSYCVVPYTRGPLRHRSHQDILREIAEAGEKGLRKFTLLGQNVNAYRSPIGGSAEVNFITLLEMVNALACVEEFSFVTSHPKDTTEELFHAMAALGKLKKYLHLPVQSGSDRVLQLMNRGYTRKFYLELAEKYRKIVRGGQLTTDIIVGFPTETEDDFTDTAELVRAVEFDAGFIFKYSPRPHASASGMADDVAKEEKERRHALILDTQKKISKGKKRHE